MKNVNIAALALSAALMAAPVLGVAQENSAAPATTEQAPAMSQQGPGQGMGRHGHMRAADPAKRLEWMSKKLNLTDDQKAKLQPIFNDEFQQMKAVREDTSLNREQKRDKMKQIHETFHPQVLAVLTPDQQQKLEQMRAARQAKRGKGAPATQENNTQQPQ